MSIPEGPWAWAAVVEAGGAIVMMVYLVRSVVVGRLHGAAPFTARELVVWLTMALVCALLWWIMWFPLALHGRQERRA